MGMVEEDFERVRGEVGEIIGRELLEGGDEVLGGVLDVRGVGVGFEFVFAREEVALARWPRHHWSRTCV